jgi:pentatricopeptide repeat protein
VSGYKCARLLVQAEGIMGAMRARGLQPSSVTYGCALAGCEVSGDVDRAVRLYKEACTEGLLPTDPLHNALIKVCVRAGRLDEALEQIKTLIRSHGRMEQHTINSLTRALSDQYIGALPLPHTLLDTTTLLHPALCCIQPALRPLRLQTAHSTCCASCVCAR